MGSICSLQICEISHQTFGPSHQKCSMCPMILVNLAFFKQESVSKYFWPMLKHSVSILYSCNIYWNMDLHLSTRPLHRSWSSTSVSNALIELYLIPLVNSLDPGWCGHNLKSIIFKLIIQNCRLGTWCEIALRWMPGDSTMISRHWFR